jgi:hypothetical protein
MLKSQPKTKGIVVNLEADVVRAVFGILINLKS